MDLRNVNAEAIRRRKSFNYILQNARMDDLLNQIEYLKPLLTNADPEIVLKASQEIRDIHTKISEISQLIASTVPAFKRRKWIPKSQRRKRTRDKIAVQPTNENIFRPQ